MVIAFRCPGGGTGSTGRVTILWVRAHAIFRQLPEQYRWRRTRWNGAEQTGQMSSSAEAFGLADVVVMSSRDEISAVTS